MWFEAMWWGSLQQFSDTGPKEIWEGSHQTEITSATYQVPLAGLPQVHHSAICNFQQLLCHCRTSQMRQLGDVDRTENRHGMTEQWSFLFVLQLRNSCCSFRKLGAWSFPDMHVVACVVLVVSFPRIFEEIYSSMPSICSLGQKNHAIQPINNQVRGERQSQEQSEKWSWFARQDMTAATFLNSVI